MCFLAIILLVPSVLALTSQQFINNYNISTPARQVISAPMNSIEMMMQGSRGTLLATSNNGMATVNPVEGEDLTFAVRDDMILDNFFIVDDNFTLQHNLTLTGLKKTFFGWSDDYAESSVNTKGWQTNKDYHAIFYSMKLNRTINQYYADSWKVFTFTLEQQKTVIPTTNVTTPIFGPLAGKNVSCQNVLTPSKNGLIEIDKDTTLCFQQIYDVKNPIIITKNGATLDCNEATITPIPTKLSPMPNVVIVINADGVSVKNCYLENTILATEFNRRTTGIEIENNLFMGGQMALSTISDSIIRNNDIQTTGLIIDFGSKENLIEDNKILILSLQYSDKSEITNNIINYLDLTESSNNTIKYNIIEEHQLITQILQPLALTEISAFSENNEFLNNNFMTQSVEPVVDDNDHKNTYKGNYYEGFSSNPQKCMAQNKICTAIYEIYDTALAISAEDNSASEVLN